MFPKLTFFLQDEDTEALNWTAVNSLIYAEVLIKKLELMATLLGDGNTLATKTIMGTKMISIKVKW